MNGIEKITGRIAADTQAEVDRILEAAREEAARITAQFQEQAERERTELAAQNQAAAEERLERLTGAAQMEARKALLAVKQELVEESYAAALEELCALPEDAYAEIAAGLLVRASSTGHEEVIFSRKDRERVGSAAVEKANARGMHLTLSEETRDIRGGFILRGGRVEVNCAFETLIRQQKSQTAPAVSKLLFRES